MIIIVAALTKERVIGRGNALPWRIPEEMKHFRSIVNGKTMLMGRATFESMKGMLASVGGHSIVLTNSKMELKDADACGNLEEALDKGEEYGEDIYVVGGQSIFEQTIEIADMMCLSYIDGNYAGDKFFPSIDTGIWRVESRERFKEFEYVVYSRRRP